MLQARCQFIVYGLWHCLRLCSYTLVASTGRTPTKTCIQNTLCPFLADSHFYCTTITEGLTRGTRIVLTIRIYSMYRKTARNVTTPNCFCQRPYDRRYATKQFSVKHNLQRHLNFLQFRITFFWTICELLLFTLTFFKEVPPLYTTEANKGHSEGQDPVCWFPVAHKSNEARNQQ